MSDDVLELFVRQYLSQQEGPEVNFLWQGGEPTLAGVEFYRKVVLLQSKYSDGRRVTNSIQTNATVLDHAFCSFLKEHNFLVGVSIDGPPDIHDNLRPTKGGTTSFVDTLQGLELLRSFEIEFNILCVVHSKNSKQPLRVYEFLKSIGGKYIQFIPLVERLKETVDSNGIQLALPTYDGTTAMMPWSVEPRDYGDFLTTIFDHWFTYDIGKTFVQIFDVTLENWLGLEPSLCIFRTTCGGAVGLEKNGDIYSCDHYVFPEFLLGNLADASLDTMINSSKQVAFGNAKRTNLPQQCIDCPVYFACKGECPKNRFALSNAGEPGLNYLCEGYFTFFGHVFEAMNQMATAIDPTFGPRILGHNK